MPFKMSDYLEAYVLNLILRASGALPPSTVYLGLLTDLTESTDGQTRTEVSTTSTGYSRIPITFNAFSNGSGSNSTLLDFPTAITNWGQITYFGLFDALTGGNLLYWGNVTTPPTIITGQQFEVAVGALTVTISGNLTTALANQIGEHTLRNNRYTSPATVYAGILTAFTSDVVYTELGDANYHRQSFSSSVPSGVVTQISNSTVITFPGPANQYTASYLAVFDALTSGNMLLRAPLTPSQVVPVAKTLVFNAGTTQFTSD